MKISKSDWKSKLLTVIFIIIALPCFAQDVLPCDNSSESNIKIINMIAPTFPTRPYDNKISEGFVKLRIEVNSSGLVQKVMILESKFSTSNEQGLRCGIITYDYKLE